MNEALHYFVDESGSGVLFNRKGRVIIGEEGTPRYFALGLLAVNDPAMLDHQIATLQQQVELDPYFADVPSVQKRRVEGGFYFHATDDVPEIRKWMFELLLASEVKFSAVVKDMVEVLEYVRRRNQLDASYRYRPNELYDFTARMLFRQKLHRANSYKICFAKRGNSDRTVALRNGLQATRDSYINRQGLTSSSQFQVRTAPAMRENLLQAADYFLWALQRAFERHEDRYIRYLWERIGVIHDVDDKRSAEYGVYYTKKRPLTAALITRPGI